MVECSGSSATPIRWMDVFYPSREILKAKRGVKEVETRSVWRFGGKKQRVVWLKLQIQILDVRVKVFRTIATWKSKLSHL